MAQSKIAHGETTNEHSILDQIAELKVNFPQNIAIQSFDLKDYEALSPDLQKRLLNCLKSGIENPDSSMGCYALLPSDYDDLSCFFSKALARHHHVDETAQHHSNWHINARLDLKQLDLPPLSTRIRVGRNLKDFPLPAAMSLDQRLALEQRMIAVFDVLNTLPAYQGRYYSLTQDTPHSIHQTDYDDLVAAHLMFKDMSDDPYLKSAGIACHWPHGRGCYVSHDHSFIIWVGEEDHLRIMCMQKTQHLESVFNLLKTALKVIDEQTDLQFAHSERFGHITSCPTNLGTAMRASLHIQLPQLTAQGNDTRLKQIASPLGLSVRGLGGEHTPIGTDGTVDISPKARYCITEAAIITSLYQGVETLLQHERA